jgi:rhodanese-related sulfurtransferase
VPALEPLSVADLRAEVGRGAQIVDARSIEHFAAGHIPGSLSIELRPVFATWLGWLTDAERPIAFVLDDEQDRHELVRQSLTVGIETLAGELAGGFASWVAAGLPVASIDLVDSGSLDRRTVIDVRQHDEFAAGHVPGARNIELGELAHTATSPTGPVTVMCGHGERAMTGASLLARGGASALTVLAGGPSDWAQSTGRALVSGA